MSEETTKPPKPTDLDDDLEAGEERGCAWLMPYVAVALVLLYLAYFVIENSAPIDLWIFPYWRCFIRPPTLVAVSILIGVGLTLLWSWARHRMRLASRKSD